MHLRVICICVRKWLASNRTNPVYMCICNALTDRTLKQAADTIGSIKPGQVYAACGCRLQCGRCVRAVMDMLRNHGSEAREQLQGAD
jgi:bacterioferritin-associated ferredoxin